MSPSLTGDQLILLIFKTSVGLYGIYLAKVQNIYNRMLDYVVNF
jgi:hypothetical protein